MADFRRLYGRGRTAALTNQPSNRRRNVTVSTSPLQPVPNSQYDADSAPNQNYNCGPTTVTNVLQFMVDRDYPINDTRRLATTANYCGTNMSQRKTMFDKRGVPASVQHYSHAQVKARLNGHCAFDLALMMGEIPLVIRKRPFAGAHSVEAVAQGYAICPQHGVKEPGIWVNNPDYNRGHQPYRYFYPDHAWQPAYDKLGGWCVVPDKDKVIPTRTAFVRKCKVNAACWARTGPGTQYTQIKVMPVGTLFTSTLKETNGGLYAGNRKDWIGFTLNGRTVWCAAAYITLL
jgi:hypothetical protein